ncbi:MAG: hypothetical protein FWE42_04470 [Defluviitaleaceae bacterium]|nr:hypothetical protein [Defluviitaleaceae bacterium]
MVKESAVKGGLFGFLLNLFSGQESKTNEVSWLTETKQREVKKMYCDQCGFELGYETSTCTQCGRQMPNAESDSGIDLGIDSGMVRNYDAMPEQAYDATPEPTPTPDSEPVLAPQEAEWNPPLEEYSETEQNELPEEQTEEPCTGGEGEEPCAQQEPEPNECQNQDQCPEESPKQEPLNYAQKKDKKAILGQEIEELKHRVQPCLDEIARLSNYASADSYSASLDSIRSALDHAKDVECALREKTVEYESIIINPCCEHGFHNADKYCGTCGEYLGGVGWYCSSCQILNKGDNHFCRGCGNTPAA